MQQRAWHTVDRRRSQLALNIQQGVHAAWHVGLPACGDAQGRPSPGADVAGGVAVPVLMWQGGGPVLVQMWQGESQSRCRCGRASPVPVQMWQGKAQPQQMPLRKRATVVRARSNSPRYERRGSGLACCMCYTLHDACCMLHDAFMMHVVRCMDACCTYLNVVRCMMHVARI